MKRKKRIPTRIQSKYDTFSAIMLFVFSLLTFYVAKNYFLPSLKLASLGMLDFYQSISIGKIDFSPLLGAIMFILVFYVYASAFYISWMMIREKKDYSTGFFSGLWNCAVQVQKEKKRHLWLFLTGLLSVSLMFVGSKFLFEAFPAEPILFEGAEGNLGSILKCEGHGKYNLISEYGYNCHILLQSEKSYLKTKKVTYETRVNHSTKKFEVDKYYDGGGFSTYFSNSRIPSHIRVRYHEGEEELFTLHNKGVYSLNEYYTRAREKAVWFFAIISASIFSVFSAMNSLYQIWDR